MSARRIEYVTQDGHLTDPSDGIVVRTNWTASAIEDAINHLTPVFEKTKPEIVLAGINRQGVDYMEIYALYRGEEDLQRYSQVYEADEDWMSARGARENRFLDLSCFSSTRLGLDQAISNRDLSAISTRLGVSPRHLRQIYPTENPPMKQP